MPLSKGEEQRQDCFVVFFREKTIKYGNCTLGMISAVFKF